MVLFLGYFSKIHLLIELGYHTYVLLATLLNFILEHDVRFGLYSNKY